MFSLFKKLIADFIGRLPIFFTVSGMFRTGCVEKPDTGKHKLTVWSTTQLLDLGEVHWTPHYIHQCNTISQTSKHLDLSPQAWSAPITGIRLSGVPFRLALDMYIKLTCQVQLILQ